MEFTTVCSSSFGCAYVLSSKGLANLLLDCGASAGAVRFHAGNLARLAGCLVTHAHGDHASLVPALTRRGVECYMSGETAEALLPEVIKHGDPRNIVAVSPGIDFRLDGWRVLPFDAVHDAPGTFGFIVGDRQGDRLLYLTDSAYSNHTFEGLTMIAVECNYSEENLRGALVDGKTPPPQYARTFRTHMSLERLVEMLKANDLSKVRAIHLLHLSDRHGDEEGFRKAVARETGIPVYVAPKVNAL